MLYALQKYIWLSDLFSIQYVHNLPYQGVEHSIIVFFDEDILCGQTDSDEFHIVAGTIQRDVVRAGVVDGELFAEGILKNVEDSDDISYNYAVT